MKILKHYSKDIKKRHVKLGQRVNKKGDNILNHIINNESTKGFGYTIYKIQLLRYYISYYESVNKKEISEIELNETIFSVDFIKNRKSLIDRNILFTPLMESNGIFTNPDSNFDIKKLPPLFIILKVIGEDELSNKLPIYHPANKSKKMLTPDETREFRDYVKCNRSTFASYVKFLHELLNIEKPCSSSLEISDLEKTAYFMVNLNKSYNGNLISALNNINETDSILISNALDISHPIFDNRIKEQHKLEKNNPNTIKAVIQEFYSYMLYSSDIKCAMDIISLPKTIEETLSIIKKSHYDAYKISNKNYIEFTKIMRPTMYLLMCKKINYIRKITKKNTFERIALNLNIEEQKNTLRIKLAIIDKIKQTSKLDMHLYNKILFKLSQDDINIEDYIRKNRNSLTLTEGNTSKDKDKKELLCILGLFYLLKTNGLIEFLNEKEKIAAIIKVILKEKITNTNIPYKKNIASSGNNKIASGDCFKSLYKYSVITCFSIGNESDITTIDTIPLVHRIYWIERFHQEHFSIINDSFNYHYIHSRKEAIKNMLNILELTSKGIGTETNSSEYNLNLLKQVFNP